VRPLPRTLLHPGRKDGADARLALCKLASVKKHRLVAKIDQVMPMRDILIACLAMTVALVSEESMSAQVPEADPDKGLVVFYRVANLKGGAIRFSLQHSDEVIGTLTNGSFLYKYLEPGQHTFWSQVISQDSITLTVVGGKIYDVKGEPKLEIYAGRSQFTQVSETQAQADLASL
jgi:hypothetical protein